VKQKKTGTEGGSAVFRCTKQFSGKKVCGDSHVDEGEGTTVKGEVVATSREHRRKQKEGRSDRVRVIRFVKGTTGAPLNAEKGRCTFQREQGNAVIAKLDQRGKRGGGGREQRGTINGQPEKKKLGGQILLSRVKGGERRMP